MQCQLRGQDLTTEVNDTRVAHSRLRPFTSYTREGASAAWKCDVVVAPPRAA